jgi:hypothetical protein
VLPEGWTAEPDRVELAEPGVARFRVTAAATPAMRVRVAADLVVRGRPAGQQAEALIDVR